ncbi:MAG TPA: phosphotransferase, partial [Pirellulales bacterium]|nr:phosphotransferase [Pirellulales bacterium]
MLLVDEHSAEDYLRSRGHVAPGEPVHVRELPGGVSNMVLLVERPEQPARRFVLKQARHQLRTTREWFASLERNWREADVLGVCAELMRTPPLVGAPGRWVARTPEILFEDRDNYLFAMTAAPELVSVWKQDLLEERVEPSIAAACGGLLATLHGRSWLDRSLATRLGDRTLFEQLRVEPYYQSLAAQRPEIASPLHGLMQSLEKHPRSLVHADFSPKNLLVSD